MNKPISLAFSPCPNDTFIFDALVHGRIDTEGLKFRYVLEDVDTLNKAAGNAVYEVTKLSFHAFFYVADSYVALTSGGAFCNNFGPVFVARKQLKPEEIENSVVAVPGLQTTAALLFSHYFKALRLEPYLFTAIEHAVSSGRADAGVIIHENVFTYESQGLVGLANLGHMWTKDTGLPVPLGCIAVKRNLPVALQQTIDRLIRKSVQFAFDNPETSYNFVKQNAASLSDTVIQKHIKTYVNNDSTTLGQAARNAVMLLYKGLADKGVLPHAMQTLFIDE